jgi:excisionase family DNA binding protein
MEKLYSTAEAAKILGISVIRVQKLAQEGRMGRKIGRDWVFNDDDLEAVKNRPTGYPVGRPRNPIDPSYKSCDVCDRLVKNLYKVGDKKACRTCRRKELGK